MEFDSLFYKQNKAQIKFSYEYTVESLKSRRLEKNKSVRECSWASPTASLQLESMKTYTEDMRASNRVGQT